MNPEGRQYDLDWLRVVAFGTLIFYHIGMFYVTWDWYLKSRHSASFVEPVMGLTACRLSLLFFISGAAVRYAIDKTTVRRFLSQRVTRLLVPLAFGMAVVCAPQTYVELRYLGEIEPGYLAFYRDYLGFRGVLDGQAALEPPLVRSLHPRLHRWSWRCACRC